MTTRALVLSGGGVAGIAWQLGLAEGLTQAGVQLRTADLIVGTSAGSVVGATVRADAVNVGYRRQLERPENLSEAPPWDPELMMKSLQSAAAQSTSRQDARARLAALALRRGSEGTEDERLAVVRSGLVSDTWPAEPMLVTAVDAIDGAFVTFDAGSGVDFVRAIAASCAAPLVWPPVTIDSHRYMDGGVRSLSNADLAAGHDRVLIVSCFPEPPINPFGPSLSQVTDALRQSGEVFHVQADGASLAAYGANPLDPASRAASARAGVRQATGVADAVGSFWG
jgi:NTE family protein